MKRADFTFNYIQHTSEQRIHSPPNEFDPLTKLENEPSAPINVCMIGSLDAHILGPLVTMIRETDPKIRMFAYGALKLSNHVDVPLEEPAKRLPPEPLGFLKKRAPAPSSGNGNSATAPKKTKRLRRWAAGLNRSMDRFLNRSKVTRELQRYDIIHLQSLFDTRLLYLLDQKQLPPIVISIWGSDLLRISDLGIVGRQIRAINQSTLITMTGIEFREIALAKYGRHLNSRIRETFFSPDGKLLNNIAQLNPTEARTWAQEKFQIPTGKTLICIGHNGFPQNQHLEIIANLSQCSASLKSKFHLLIPATYGGSPGYIDQIETELNNHGFSATVVRDFLPTEDLAKMRVAVDIFVYLAISDAFSASVSQALTAGNITITGSWLPYKRRKRTGFKYWEIDSVDELSALLINLHDDLEQHRNNVKQNIPLGLQFFSDQTISQGWIDVYREALSQRNSTP